MNRMLRRRAILGGLAILGAGIAAFVLARKGDDPVREQSTFERTGEAPPARKTADGAEDGATAAVLTPLDRTGWTLRGRLVRYPDPDALEPTQPVAGALVRIALGEDSGEPRPDFAPREVRSGADGRYAFEGMPGKAKYRLDVDAEGCALRAVGFELGDAAASETKEIPDIVLDEPARLVVIVRGPGGTLRDDGRVVVSKHEGPFDSIPEDTLVAREEDIDVPRHGSGEHVLDRAPAGACWVSASAPGCAGRGEVVHLPSRKQLGMTLWPGLRLSGTVRSSTGKPLAGAEVSVERCVLERQVRADAEGRFELEGLQDGTCELSATAEGYVVIAREIRAGLEDIELVLNPEGILSGRVLAADSGEPIASATIVRQGGEELARTDEKGAFEVRKLDRGDHRDLEVHHDDHVPSSLDPVTLESGGRIDGIEVRLERGLRVEGRVRTADGGAPVVGARVNASLSGNRPEIRRSTLTGQDGSFVFSGLREGKYTVMIRAEEYVPLRSSPQAPGTLVDWTFTIQRGGSIGGRVLDPDGHPLAGIDVHPSCGKEASSEVKEALDEKLKNYTCVTDHRGRYRIAGLPPDDRYSLLFMDPRRTYMPDLVGGLRVVSGEEVKLEDVQFQRGKVMSGRVLDASGAPVPGADVGAFFLRDDAALERMYKAELEQVEGSPFLAPFAAPPLPQARTGESGEYRLEALLPGRYEIWVHVMGRVTPSPRAISIGDEAVLDGIDFVLPSGGTVSGRVVDEAGNPLEGAEITGFSGMALGPLATAHTDASGRFELGGLAARRTSIMARKPGFALRPLEADVPSEGHIVVLPAMGAVWGRLELASGEGTPPICEIRLDPLLQLRTEGTSDSTGRFVVVAPPGPSVLHAEGEGFVSPRLELDLRPGEKREVVLKLEKAGHVQVRAESNEEPESFFVLLESERPGEPPREELFSGGDCHFDSVLAGRVRLVALVPELGAAVVVDGVEVVSGETVEVTIALGSARGVSGRVYEGGLPVSGARVVARRPQGAAKSQTSIGGVYELREIEPGTCELSFEGPRSSNPLRRVVRVPESGALYLDVHLDRGRVSGTVTSGGRPAADLRIVANDGEWLSMPSDAAGAWSMDLPAPGKYLLQAYRGEEAVGSPRPVVLEGPEDDVRVDVEIEED